MRCMIVMNRLCHLEVSKGCFPKSHADLYIQVDTDITAFLEQLTVRQRKEVYNGWPVGTTRVDDLYFQEKV